MHFSQPPRSQTPQAFSLLAMQMEQPRNSPHSHLSKSPSRAWDAADGAGRPDVGIVGGGGNGRGSVDLLGRTLLPLINRGSLLLFCGLKGNLGQLEARAILCDGTGRDELGRGGTQRGTKSFADLVVGLDEGLDGRAGGGLGEGLDGLDSH